MNDEVVAARSRVKQPTEFQEAVENAEKQARTKQQEADEAEMALNDDEELQALIKQKQAAIYAADSKFGARCAAAVAKFEAEHEAATTAAKARENPSDEALAQQAETAKQDAEHKAALYDLAATHEK